MHRKYLYTCIICIYKTGYNYLTNILSSSYATQLAQESNKHAYNLFAMYMQQFVVYRLQNEIADGHKLIAVLEP